MLSTIAKPKINQINVIFQPVAFGERRLMGFVTERSVNSCFDLRPPRFDCCRNEKSIGLGKNLYREQTDKIEKLK